MLDLAQIQAILPHRPPFLFVDSISSIVPGERITGEFLVKETERFLAREGNSEFSRSKPSSATSRWPGV
jgi:hypothetical protein